MIEQLAHDIFVWLLEAQGDYVIEYFDYEFNWEPDGDEYTDDAECSFYYKGSLIGYLDNTGYESAKIN